MSLHPAFVEYWESAGYTIKKRRLRNGDHDPSPLILYYACKGRDETYIGGNHGDFSVYAFDREELSGIGEEHMLRVLAMKSFL